jgi:predicted metalloendopeptidase
MDAFYKSCQYLMTNEKCQETSRNSLEQIDEFRKDKKNLWKILAWINSNEMNSDYAPFSWKLQPDDKNPQIFRCYITSITFPIIDLSVYYDDGTNVEYKKRYRKEFIKIVNKMFRLTLPHEKNLSGENVLEVHREIFNVFGCTDVTKENQNYNKVFDSESFSKYGFDWKEFSKGLGFEQPPLFFITNNLNYLKCCSDLLIKNWDNEKWRSFWCWIFIRLNIRLSKNWRYIYYNFNGKFQRGQESNVILEKDKTFYVSAALNMSVAFNSFLTNEYVKKFKNPRVVKYVETMCKELKKVFLRIINRNTWLTPTTKKYALLKLKHLKFHIGNSLTILEDPLLGYTNNLFDNFQKIYNWRHNIFINLEGKQTFDIPYLDWASFPAKLSNSQAYVVNASYTPSKNTIYINVGYMQKPFVDLDERGIEYNLAHLGFTICHEMSHSLDDMGSQYDYKGVLYNWWSEKDKEKFETIQKDVIKQYQEYAAKDGIKFDASIGLGEDMADISGLAICDEYLRDFQTYNDDLIPIRYLSYRTFYTYYSMQMRQQIGKKSLTAQLKTNPHPLDKYRTNIPLSRSSYFRSIFNVKKGDGMWWHNENTIW